MSVCDKEAAEKLAGALVDFLSNLSVDEHAVGSAGNNDSDEDNNGLEREEEVVVGMQKAKDANLNGAEVDFVDDKLDKKEEGNSAAEKEGHASEHELEPEPEPIVSSAKGKFDEQEPQLGRESVEMPTAPPPSQGTPSHSFGSYRSTFSSSYSSSSSSSSSSYSTPVPSLPSRSHSVSSVASNGGRSWKSQHTTLPQVASGGDQTTASYKRSTFSTSDINARNPSLKERMVAYADAFASRESQRIPKATKKADPAIKQRTMAYQPKKVNAVQDRMAKFEPSPPTDGNDRVKTLPSSGPSMRERKNAFESEKENLLQNRLAQFESPSSKDFQRKAINIYINSTVSKIAQQQKRFSVHEPRKENSLQNRAAMNQSYSSSVEVRRNVVSSKVEGGLSARMAKFQKSSVPSSANSCAVGKKKDLLKQRMASYQLSQKTYEFSKDGQRSRGNELQKRMSAYADALSSHAFQKQKNQKRKSVVKDNPFVVQSRCCDFRKRASKFAEESSHGAFEKKKELVGPPGDLHRTLSTFKEMSGADASQKKRLGGDPKRVAVGSSSREFQKKMAAVEQSLTRGTNIEADTPQNNDAANCVPPPPMVFNPQEGTMDGEGKRKAYFGKVVENRVTVRDAPKDYEYLYNLCIKLERLKAQENENPCFRDILGEADETTEIDTSDEEGGRSSLEGMLGGKTSIYTAKADWITKDWIDDHLIRDEKYDSIKFRFRDHLLFKQFDKTRQKSRGVIIRTLVQKLLLYANDITQLDLSNCLLPDAFLQILAEEVMKKPQDSFPNLQLLNFESNLIQGPGIEALSEVILNERAWKYLQALLLENQKHSMSNEAEKALANAISRSHSVVVCSAPIRCSYQLKEINDTLLYNGDQLRLARREHQAKEGTLKERKRTEIELYFDSIAANESHIEEVEIVGDQKFLTLDDVEKAKSGEAFATNTSVKTVKMELLGLQDSFAATFGDAIANNSTLERVSIDSNSITGAGMKVLFDGLGRNGSIIEFQCRHQKKLMATLDEDALPDLLASNTSILKLGVDVRSKLVKLKLDRIVNANVDRVRKRRASAKTRV